MLRELWENEKQRLADILFNRIIQGKTKVCSKDILNGKYPEGFQLYVKNQAVRIFEQEKPIQCHNRDRYNLQSDQIERYFRVLRSILIQETYFTHQEVNRMTSFAINFQYDALVRPRQALSQALFKTKDRLNKNDVLEMLLGFGEDRPFIQKLISSIESFNNQIVTENAFNELATVLEREVYKKIPISAFMKDVSLLSKFETSITGKENHNLTSQVLLGMLKERSLNHLVNGLQDEAMERNCWSFEEIESALERQLLVGELELSKSITNEEPPLEVEYNKINLTTDKEESTVGQAKSLRLSFVEDESETGIEKHTQELDYSQSPKVKEIPDFVDLEKPLIINRRDIESQPPGPYPSLQSLINNKAQKLFIKKIFRKDVKKYSEFIQQLEEQDKWKDAKAIIDIELENRGISPYSKEAVHLGDIVFSRYFSQKNVAKH